MGKKKILWYKSFIFLPSWTWLNWEKKVIQNNRCCKLTHNKMVSVSKNYAKHQTECAFKKLRVSLDHELHFTLHLSTIQWFLTLIPHLNSAHFHGSRDGIGQQKNLYTPLTLPKVVKEVITFISTSRFLHNS